jgi:hypothetical protein
MLEVLPQYRGEVARPGDQEMVEAFAAQGADEPFRDRIRPWRSDWCVDDADVGAGEDGVKGGGEPAVPVANHEPDPLGPVAEVHEQVAGLLSDPGAGGVGGDPGEAYVAAVVLNHDQDVEATQEDGVDVGEVNGEDRLCLGGEELSPGGPDRCGAGSMPAALRTFHTVDAAIEWPSPISSPCMRR